MHRMIIIAGLASAVALGCGKAHQPEAPPPGAKASGVRSPGDDRRAGEFKGYADVDRFLTTRLLAPKEPHTPAFEFSRFFGEADPVAGGLNSLLGGFSGSGTTNDFRNGQPNAINSLLWYIGARSLAAQLGTVCTTQAATLKPADPTIPSFVLAPDLHAALLAACAAGNEPDAHTQAMTDLWTAVMGYDLPESEGQAFAAFHGRDEALAQLPPTGQVATAVTDLLMDPYFLLQW